MGDIGKPSFVIGRQVQNLESLRFLQTPRHEQLEQAFEGLTSFACETGKGPRKGNTPVLVNFDGKALLDDLHPRVGHPLIENQIIDCIHARSRCLL
ncbi:hypothetical protein P4193_01535 [Pseudomonas aeruginosa]|nr:hypothetical protein [Pseudomonas aeruginosa]